MAPTMPDMYICTSRPAAAAASTTLTSCVPAWLTQSDVPSAVQATPHGFPAAKYDSSKPSVLTSFFCGTSRMLTTLMVIQPNSTCVGTSSKLVFSK